MGQRVTRTDFEWVSTDEPHATRRKQILVKYPKIKQLMVHDPWLKWSTLLLVSIQLAFVYFVCNLPWVYVVVLAYAVGGTLNHSLQFAIHEVSHNLAFGCHRPIANRLLGIFCNLPMGLPACATFKKYHSDHHKYQGDEVIDSGVPTPFERALFRWTGTKLIWIILQPILFSLRPIVMRPRPITSWEIINIFTQFAFDGIILYFAGIKGLFYLIGGTILAMGLHPISGHFFAEHHMFVKGFETYSYYGPLNWICFNVGYHTEHHDFPNIPGRLLPKVRRYAPEFYNNLPYHTSWVKVLWDVVTKPDLGPYSYVVRRSKLNSTLVDPDLVVGDDATSPPTKRCTD